MILSGAPALFNPTFASPAPQNIVVITSKGFCVTVSIAFSKLPKLSSIDCATPALIASFSGQSSVIHTLAAIASHNCTTHFTVSIGFITRLHTSHTNSIVSHGKFTANLPVLASCFRLFFIEPSNVEFSLSSISNLLSTLTACQILCRKLLLSSSSNTPIGV
jgi:hypothetical protein